MNFKMWAAVLGDLFLLLGEPLSRSKFVSDMYLKFINIIGETLTNFMDFCPFANNSTIINPRCSLINVWNNHKLLKLEKMYGPIKNF